jgi:catechol 2,3-dioxygenase-like lactoylglutathione lyase family enzyme
MERVSGIGGVFLRARDPQALAAWYAEHLGLEIEAWGGAVLQSTGGESFVWALFPAETDYFGSRDRQQMVNYRVADLDAMLAQLRAAGIEADGPDENENGRFGWGTDPEGNRFELWQPPAGS